MVGFVLCCNVNEVLWHFDQGSMETVGACQVAIFIEVRIHETSRTNIWTT
jgi:hypothetical protein